MFPRVRMRRLRRGENIRGMVGETHLEISDFIYPMFVVEGKGIKEEIKSMPKQFRFSPDLIAKEAKAVRELGIPAAILFGIPAKKDELGSEAYNDRAVTQRAISAIKEEVPELTVIADVCLCEYTSHGHCGIVMEEDVDNDTTLEYLCKAALSYVRAGADMVAPSDMMDGRVGAVREALDSAGYSNTPILSYAAKYASAFYGPFRDAAESTPQFGDRRGYQMDPRNVRQALREIELDIQEGADIVMVKPALAYLDVIRAVRENFNVPVAAYNVSGEYSMLMAASKMGWLDYERTMFEMLTAIKRAGADIILTYFAKDAARALNEKKVKF